MLIVVLALQLLILLALVVVLLRKPSTAAGVADDPRLAQLLAADLPAKLDRLDGRSELLDQHLRAELGHMRADAATEASRSREATVADAERLRSALDAQLKTLAERFISFTSDTTRHHADSREALHTRLTELRTDQTAHQEKLRGVVEKQLSDLNQSNAAKLDQMRETVDEKLKATLQTRLTESFGLVTDQLAKVYTSLGEMTKLSAGVADLSRIFTNVKTRGTIGEVILETLLKQMLPPGQYIKNAKVKANTREIVEFVIKLPTSKGETWLPIDSKFPRELGERLDAAYESGNGIDAARKVFETAIRNEGKKICEKYIAPPTTTSVAIMFLPTEGLYAEVMRREGLQADIQQNCHVLIAGPSTLSAMLSSIQMGLHMLELQQKGDDVWKILSSARKDFGDFGKLLTSMENQVNTVQNTIRKLHTKSEAIEKTLSHSGVTDAEQMLPTSKSDGFDSVLPMLAAADDE